MDYSTTAVSSMDVTDTTIATTTTTAPLKQQQQSSKYHSIRIHSGVACRGKRNSETYVFTASDEATNGMEHLGEEACGEDAFFVSTLTKSLGIADGVGGWQEAGVDPKLYARTLMNFIQQDIEQEFVSRKLSLIELSTPLEVLSRSYYRILQEGIIRAGSSTACTVQLRPAERKQNATISSSNNNNNSINLDISPPSPSSPSSFASSYASPLSPSSPAQSAEAIARLHYCNIGDSGFLVFRRLPSDQLVCVYRTQDILHSFNAPFQLGVFPPEMGPGAYNDKPSDADVGNLTGLEIMDGDIIVMATDGLFDNLFDEDILSIVESNIHCHPTTIAQAIVEFATVKSKDPLYLSPFAQKAGWQERGGKPDDITAIVAFVSSADFNDSTTTA